MREQLRRESMPVGQLTTRRGRNVVGAWPSLSGLSHRRACRGKILVGASFQTLAGIAPYRRSVGDRGLSGSISSGSHAKPSTFESVGVASNVIHRVQTPACEPKPRVRWLEHWQRVADVAVYGWSTQARKQLLTQTKNSGTTQARTARNVLK